MAIIFNASRDSNSSSANIEKKPIFAPRNSIYSDEKNKGKIEK